MDAQTTSCGTVHVIDSPRMPRGGSSDAILAVGLRLVRHAGIDDFVFHEIAGPGCIVLEGPLARCSCSAAIATLGESGRRMPVVVIADRDDVPASVQAMKAGAVDYLVSPVAPPRLLAALQRAIRMDEAQRRRHAARRELLDHYLQLDADEKAIMSAMLDGKANKWIAAAFACCERTVKTRRSRVMRKFGAHSISDLVRIGRELQDAPGLRNFDSAASAARTD